MPNSYVKYLINWMKANKADDARIVFSDPIGQNVYILPSYKHIRKETAAKIIKELNMKFIPGSSDCPNHGPGTSVYVFTENLHKY